MKYVFIDPPNFDRKTMTDIRFWLSEQEADRPVEMQSWVVSEHPFFTYNCMYRVEFFDREEELMAMFVLTFSEYIYAVTNDYHSGSDPRG